MNASALEESSISFGDLSEYGNGLNCELSNKDQDGSYSVSCLDSIIGSFPENHIPNGTFSVYVAVIILDSFVIDELDL